VSVEKLEKAIVMGETIAIEFKRCGGSIESDTYESVCSMLNRFGGDLYLGVEDNGTVKGVPEKATQDLIRNFISMVGNVDVISPTVYLTPEVLDYKGAKIIHIHIPPSSEVHSYKKVIYDRVGDSDVKVTATGQIAQMYIRKQKIFTEKKVYPHIKDEDLRLDMLPQLRQLAQVRNDKHPWVKLTDGELLQSAGLIGEDAETGKIGYNLAAIMLLGRDGVIFSIDPVYRTDAIVPLDESYSFDARSKKAPKTENGALIEALIIKHLHDDPRTTQLEICTATGSTRRVVQKAFAALQEKGQLRREGSKMNGVWIVEAPENGDV